MNLRGNPISDILSASDQCCENVAPERISWLWEANDEFREPRGIIWFGGSQAVLPVRPKSQGKKEPDACSHDCF